MRRAAFRPAAPPWMTTRVSLVARMLIGISPLPSGLRADFFPPQSPVLSPRYFFWSAMSTMSVSGVWRDHDLWADTLAPPPPHTLLPFPFGRPAGPHLVVPPCAPRARAARRGPTPGPRSDRF